jgi:polar amino acid transport system substrate-binding protein
MHLHIVERIGSMRIWIRCLSMSNAWRLLRGTLSFLVFVFLLASRPTPGFCADHLQTIQARGELLWGADAEGGAPYVYPDPQKPEQMAGFEFDLANALAAKLGVKARMVQNQWDQLMPALDRGNFDIILNGLEITADNRQHAAMSRPYYVYAQQIVTRARNQGRPISTDLKGKTVGVLASSAAQRLVQRLGGVEVKSYPGNVESFLDLKAERIDVVVLDLPIALYYAKGDPALKFSGEPFSPGYYGIGVRKEDTTCWPRSTRRWSNWPRRHAGAHLPQIRFVGRTAGTAEGLPARDGGAKEIHLDPARMAEVPAAVVARGGGHRGTLRAGHGPGGGGRPGGGAGAALWRGAAALAGAGLCGGRARDAAADPAFSYLLRPAADRIASQRLLAGILGLGLNYAANEAENYRAGIQSIPKGQTEASLALGMSRWQILRRISSCRRPCAWSFRR